MPHIPDHYYSVFHAFNRTDAVTKGRELELQKKQNIRELDRIPEICRGVVEYFCLRGANNIRRTI